MAPIPGVATASLMVPTPGSCSQWNSSDGTGPASSSSGQRCCAHDQESTHTGSPSVPFTIHSKAETIHKCLSPGAEGHHKAPRTGLVSATHSTAQDPCLLCPIIVGTAFSSSTTLLAPCFLLRLNKVSSPGQWCPGMMGAKVSSLRARTPQVGRGLTVCQDVVLAAQDALIMASA